jgi:hypothetical protein
LASGFFVSGFFVSDDVDDSDALLDVDDSLEDVLSELPDDESDAGPVDDPADPRLSVLKKPLPLNVTPTGWKTFLTAIFLPVSGCLILVSVSSVNACWISMVSPVSTNL